MQPSLGLVPERPVPRRITYPQACARIRSAVVYARLARLRGDEGVLSFHSSFSLALRVL